MNKLKVTVISIIILCVIVAILINNKLKMAEKTEIEKISSTHVVVTSPLRQNLTDSFTLVGTTQANNDVAIASEAQGKVKEVFARVGDYVQAGSVIVRLDDELKEANLETAEVNYLKAKRDVERFERLHSDSTVSDSQIESARLAFKAAEAQYTMAKRQYNDTRVTSPISGILTGRTVDVGTMVQNGMIIGNVVDISKLKVKVNVAEKQVFPMKRGDSVQVTTTVYPGIIFVGTISTISAKGDDSHTYPVEILLPNNSEHPLKAGMFARATFTTVAEHIALVIPRNALVGSIKKPQVFVVENNIAKLRAIVIGAESESFLEVLGGLEGGELIVTEGKNNLKDGFAVTIAQSLTDSTN